MKAVKIALIAAAGERNELGFQNQIPWHLSRDLKRFKALTSGHPVIMGRKTCESLPKPLPNRENIVITSRGGFRREGFTITGSLPAAMAAAEQTARASGAEKIFIIGGGQIYAEALKNDLCDEILLTRIHHEFQADVYFPDFDKRKFRLARSEDGEEDGLRFSFLDYEKI